MIKEKHAFVSGGKTYYKQMVKGKVITANTAEELEQKVTEYKNLIKSGKQDYSQITLGDYIFTWYDKKQKEVQECTAIPYRYAAVEIIKRIGKTRLLDCTPALLESCVQGFANEKLKSTGHYPSQDYIDNMVSVLRMIFKQAKKEMIFPYNYAEDISVKTKTKRKGTGHRALTEEEINRIAYSDVDELVYQSQLHNALDLAMSERLTEEQRQIIHRQYYDGCEDFMCSPPYATEKRRQAVVLVYCSYKSACVVLNAELSKRVLSTSL